jgi:Rdx family protein
VFEVSFGKKLIFSKKATGRFPENGEILEALA